MYKLFIRPFLFLFDPEKVHHFTFSCIKILFQIPFVTYLVQSTHVLKHPSLEREVFGIKFPNPVGLAAGLDKDAVLINELACFGFGFIEIGTLTPKPQPGNDKPRLFRVKQDQGLINRMGFNNRGVDVAVNELKKKNEGIIVGGNIGKNKVTPNEDAILDYILCFEKLFDWVDYFVVNVSSPNTPGLRELQEKEPLKKLLFQLKERNQSKPQPKPILLKIAPDLTHTQLDDIVEIVIETGIQGIIATNTTIDRANLKTEQEQLDLIGAGGLSGKPLRNKSTEVIRYICAKSNKAFPVIAVGGIHSAEDAIEKLEAGAALVQIYTGFIYEGPALINQINKAIIEKSNN